MPAPHCSIVFASADSVLRFIDPRKPGLQVLLNPLQSFLHQLFFIKHYSGQAVVLFLPAVLMITSKESVFSLLTA